MQLLDSKVIIKNELYLEIVAYFSSSPPEIGGILGGNCNVITHFNKDPISKQGLGCYIPSVHYFNRIITIWESNGIAFMGLIHSHRKKTILSEPDLDYAAKIVNELGRSVVLGVFVYETSKLYFYRILKRDNDLFVMDLQYFVD